MSMSQTSNSQAGGHQQKPSVECYNCGSQDHLFNACPEETRSAPQGWLNAKAKRERREAGAQAQGNGYGIQHLQKPWVQKYQGPVVTKYPQVKPPVVTRYVQSPPQNQPQHFQGTYPPPNPAPYYPPGPPPQQNFGPPNQPPHVNPQWQAQPPQPNYNQYPHSGYASQPQYNQQQAPQYQGQYLPTYPSVPNHPPVQQHGYVGQQAPYQTRDMSHGYQQPNYAAYPNQPHANHNQHQGSVNNQQTQWAQPPAEYYAHQQNPQHFNAPVQPYYPPPQQQYSYNASQNHRPAPYPQIHSQMAPPIQSYQQHAQPQYKPSFHQNYQGNNQNAGPPPPNCDQNFAHSQRSASATSSQPQSSQSQGSAQAPFSDEEETEWILERYLTMRMGRYGQSKPLADLTIDDYYALLSDDQGFCDPIGRPLPDTFNEDLILPPVYGATCVVSRFVTPSNKSEFIKRIRDQWPSTQFASDPFFSDADEVTWRKDFRCWVDQHCGSTVDQDVVQTEPKSLKRAASSREEDHEEVEGGENVQEHSVEPVKNNKRARIDNSNTSPSNPVDSSRLTPTNISSSAERSTPPSFDRASTPSFNCGGEGAEAVPAGEDDPWTIEPGEGSAQVEYTEPAHQVLAIPEPYGKTPGSRGSRASHSSQYTRSANLSEQKSNGPYNQSQAPKGQDSGYISARSSYSSSEGNKAGCAGRNNHNYSTNVGQRHPSHDQGHMVPESPMSVASNNSPLTPVSMELLGQTAQPPPSKSKSIHAMPRVKRRQPDVDAAYSRRW